MIALAEKLVWQMTGCYTGFMPKKETMTINKLAEIMKQGFDETHSLIKLTHLEMAKDKDLQEIKKTVNVLYEMLDDEARFIQQMRSEYPILIKRLERIEKKLGLPHRLSES